MALCFRDVQMTTNTDKQQGTLDVAEIPGSSLIVEFTAGNKPDAPARPMEIKGTTPFTRQGRNFTFQIDGNNIKFTIMDSIEAEAFDRALQKLRHDNNCMIQTTPNSPTSLPACLFVGAKTVHSGAGVHLPARPQKHEDAQDRLCRPKELSKRRKSRDQKSKKKRCASSSAGKAHFMALKLAEEQAQREQDKEKEEEATNPMKLLEKRTHQSKQELELLESLEELKDLNRRQQTIDYDEMLQQYDTEAAKQRTIKEQEELDEAYVQSIFRKRKLTGKVIEEEIIELEEPEVSFSHSERPRKVQKTTFEGSNASSSGKSRDEESGKPSASSSREDTSGKPGTATSSSSGETSRSSWSSSALSHRKNDNLVKKKASLGIITGVQKKVRAKELEGGKLDEVKGVEGAAEAGAREESKKNGGLSLLGAYSGSEEESDNDDN